MNREKCRELSDAFEAHRQLAHVDDVANKRSYYLNAATGYTSAVLVPQELTGMPFVNVTEAVRADIRAKLTAAARRVLDLGGEL